MTHRILSRLFAVAVALALAAPALAQTGLVKGKVVDATGKPVPGATVAIKSTEGVGRTLSAKSDKRGEFVQLGLQPGTYEITVSHDTLGSGGAGARVRIGDTSTVTITLSTVPPGTDPKVAELRKAFDEGVTASRAGDYDTAIAKFQAALALQPNCHQCYFNMGYAYAQMQDEQRAEETWKKALDLQADHAETLNSLATLYNNQKRFDEAAAMSARAAASAPAGNSDAIYNQGIILWNAGKIAEAKVKFEEAVAANPASADAHFQLGMALLNEGKVPEAVSSFEQYMKLDPTGQFAGQAKAMLAQLKPPPV
ncbi:MAG TPA: tetratricopeptide repeat protein [Vicinamibacterales bacterium]|nr:tetratricopeptide repeat protein [Vicinamibacterales bacterium]